MKQMKVKRYQVMKRNILILSIILTFGTRVFASPDQMVELTGHEIPFSVDSNNKKSKTHFDMSRHSANPMNYGKFYELFKNLPIQIQKSEYLEASCDDSGELWTVNGSLYDHDSGKVLYQAPDTHESVSITPNGKFLFVSGIVDGEDGEVGLPNIYHVPQMTRVSVDENGITFVDHIGNGRYELVEKKDGSKWLADFENGFKLIRPVNEGEVWEAAVCESADGQLLLKQDYNGMTLYSLPNFELIQHYQNMGSGTPFINDTGSVIGCRGILCYLTNRSTGETKGYGMDRQSCEKLVEGESTPDHMKSIVDGKVVLQKAITIDKAVNFIDPNSFEEEKQASAFEALSSLSPPIANSDCGIGAVFTPRGTSDVLIVINRIQQDVSSIPTKAGEAIAPAPARPPNQFDDRKGDCLILAVGEDLKIKKIFHYTHFLKNPFWDDKTNSIICQVSESSCAQIPVAP